MKRALISAAVAVGLLAAGHLAAGTASGDGFVQLLPELTQRQPYGLSVRATEGRYLLGFNSAISNSGDGPLLIEGQRAGTSDPMVARQDVLLDNDDREELSSFGEFRYETAGGHSHWHLDDFSRYELRETTGNHLVAPHTKAGFCLADSTETSAEDLPGEPNAPVFSGSGCAPNHPASLDVSEGISVGYTDIYLAYLEGQHVDLTGVPEGRYLLLHRVDPDGLIKEKDDSNNSASVEIDLRWPAGIDQPPVVQRCTGDSCSPVPGPTSGQPSQQPSPSQTAAQAGIELPRMTWQSARTRARRAVRRRFGNVHPRISCDRVDPHSFDCHVRWARGPFAFRGVVKVGFRATNDGARSFSSTKVKRRRR